MNFLEIANYISDQQDGDRLSTVYNADLGTLDQSVRRVRDNINRAYTLIKLALGTRNENAETSFTLTTTAGVEYVAIPAGVLTVLQLQYDNDPPMRLIPWTEYERYKADTLVITDEGSPDVASIYQRRVYFYPAPDGVYTINGRGLETLTRLSADADEPDLPAEFHQAIADLALHFEMAYEGNPAAGILLTQENGSLQAQGGQAAVAVTLFNAAKRNFRSHGTEPPRMIGTQEMSKMNHLRRVIRG